MELKPLKVSELNQYIKRLIISDPILYNIGVEGEISNFKHHQNGHMYFTIKDEKSKLRCIMFNENSSSIDWIPEDGVSVKANGYISIYDKEGTYQLYVKKLEKKGIGELYEALQKLKLKLEDEGIFSEDAKKSLPFLPKRVGVITSSTGAVVRDIVTTIKRRMDSTDIFIYQATVQGENAQASICKGIDYFNKQKDVDVIIIARGGGSIEELWAFNKEQIAREIYKSRMPIISAVGHETDFTISDFVADIRASTPSVAGEIVVPSHGDLIFKLKTLISDLLYNQNKIIDSKVKQIDDLKREINLHSPERKLEEYKNKLEFLWEDLRFQITQRIEEDKNNMDKLASRLNALSPLSTLERGFSLATNSEGKTLNSIKDVTIDEDINMTLSDGKLKVKILDIESKVK